MGIYKETSENDIETYFVEQCRLNNIIIAKQTGFVGIPDRLIVGYGRMFFVELKKPGKKPRKSQEEIIRRLRKHGATVYVADNKAQIDEIIQALMEGRNVDGTKKRKPRTKKETDKSN